MSELIERQHEAESIIFPPLPPFPLPLLRDAQAVWDGPVAAEWRQQLKTFGKIAAALNLDDKTLEDDLRENLRKFLETEPRGARRRRAKLRKRQPDPLYQVEQHVARNKAKEDLVRVARTRWGDKAAKAVSYIILDGKSEKEAALLAGVPYQSLRRWMVKLRKIGTKPAQSTAPQDIF